MPEPDRQREAFPSTVTHQNVRRYRNVPGSARRSERRITQAPTNSLQPTQLQHQCRGVEKPSGSFIGLASVCSMILFRAAIKIGALLNSQRLVMNIANDMGLRFKDNLAALDGSLHLTVHNHALGNDSSDDLGLRRDNERSAMQVTLYLTIDLDQAICGHMA